MRRMSALWLAALLLAFPVSGRAEESAAGHSTAADTTRAVTMPADSSAGMPLEDTLDPYGPYTRALEHLAASRATARAELENALGRAP